jgi:hypothetical protein
MKAIHGASFCSEHFWLVEHPLNCGLPGQSFNGPESTKYVLKQKILTLRSRMAP